MPHDSSKTRPERRKAPAGSTVRIDGLHVSRAAWARVEALVEQMRRAGIPRAHRSGALDLLLVYPELAAQVLVGGCTIYRCVTCAAWLPEGPGTEHAGHQVQDFDVLIN